MKQSFLDYQKKTVIKSRFFLILGRIRIFFSPRNRSEDSDQYETDPKHWTTACLKSLYPFHMVTYYLKWVKTSWTYYTG